NGAAQQGHLVTPLIFKITDKAYKLTGIGKTQTNAGTGLQSFPFEVAQGSDEVGSGYLFGWHTGDLAGNQNAGAVEFEDTPRARMTIVTADGALDGQKLKLGQSYRRQSEYPRTYSIGAISKKP
ncbi:MAG: hypothetical protein HQ581_02195, partial [Planctomycetes bacterium]|nr:hypothetical protein [Planctomycetota bacterium]